MFLFLFLSICLNVLVVNTLQEDPKRLLLNDPDVILDRLTRLENQVVQLQNDNKILTQKNQQQALTIKTVEASMAAVQLQQSE